MSGRLLNTNIKKVAFSNVLSQLINIGAQFITVPFFIYYWGLGYYGEWLILFTVPGYVAFSDFGMTAVINNEILAFVAKKNIEKASELFNVSLSAFIVGSIIICLGCQAAMVLIDMSYVFNITFLQKEVNSIILLLTLYALSTIFYSLLLGIFKSTDKFHIGILGGNVMKIVEIIGIILLLASGHSALSVAIALLLIRTSMLLILLIYLTRTVNWLIIRPNLYKIAILKPYIPLSVTYSLFPIGQALLIQGSTFMVGHALGPVQTVVFNTTRTLVNALKQLLEIIKQSVWVDISKHLRVGHIASAFQLYLRLIKISWLLLLTAAFVMALLGPWVYTTWTAGNVPFNGPFFYLLIAAVIANAGWFTSSVVLESTNQHYHFAIYYFIGCLAVLLSTYLFIQLQLGILAYPLSLIITEIILSILMFGFIKNIFKGMYIFS